MLKQIPQTLYTKDQLNELKLDMEVELGARLSKLTYPPNVKIQCKMRPNECTFEYVFGPVDDKHYKMETCQNEHLKECYFNAQTKQLYGQMLILIRSKPMIEDFLKEKFDEGSLKRLQPKKLLPSILSKGTGQVFDLYGTVKNYESRRKLKKKFDNIVNEIKGKLLNKKKPRKQAQQAVNIPLIKIHVIENIQNSKLNTSVINTILTSPNISKPTQPLISQPIFSIPKKHLLSKEKKQKKTNEKVLLSPCIKNPTTTSKREGIQNISVSIFSYDMTPPRLLSPAQFQNIFDSSPRALRQQFEFQQQH